MYDFNTLINSVNNEKTSITFNKNALFIVANVFKSTGMNITSDGYDKTVLGDFIQKVTSSYNDGDEYNEMTVEIDRVEVGVIDRVLCQILDRTSVAAERDGGIPEKFFPIYRLKLV